MTPKAPPSTGMTPPDALLLTPSMETPLTSAPSTKPAKKSSLPVTQAPSSGAITVISAAQAVVGAPITPRPAARYNAARTPCNQPTCLVGLPPLRVLPKTRFKFLPPSTVVSQPYRRQAKKATTSGLSDCLAIRPLALAEPLLTKQLNTQP